MREGWKEAGLRVVGALWVVLSTAMGASAVSVSGQEMGRFADICFPAAVDSAGVEQERTPSGALPATQVPRWDERDQRCRSIVEDSLLSSSSVQQARGILEELAPRVRDRARGHTEEVLDGYSGRELEAAEQQWQVSVRQAETWAGRVDQEIDRVGRWLSEIRRMEARWSATASAMPGDSLLVALAPGINTSLARSSDLASRLSLLQADLISVAGVLAELETTARISLNRVERARAQVRQQLLRRVDDPLIPALSTAWDPADTWGRLRAGVGDRWDFFQEWVASDPVPVLVHLTLILVLALLVRAVGRVHPPGEQAEVPAGESESGGDPEEGGNASPGSSDLTEVMAAEAAIRHPIATAYVLSLVASTLIYSEAPTIVRDLAFILSALPLAVLVASALTGPQRTTGLQVTALAGITVLGTLVLPVSLTRRVFVLATALAGLIIFRRLERAFLGISSGTLFKAVVQKALPVARLGLLVTILAELAGMSALAEFVGPAILILLFLAQLLRFLMLALVGLVKILPETRLGDVVLAVRAQSQVVVDRTRAILGLLMVVLWVWSALRLYDLGGFVEGAILSVLEFPMELGNISLSPGDILAFVFTVWLAFQISKLIRFVLQEDVFPRMDLPKGVPTAVSSLTHYFLITGGFIVALSAASIDLDRIALLISALGVGIGFGLQGIVGNFVSGLVLLFERPVNVGDTVELQNMLATVQRIGMRSSTLRTVEGAEVIVPNNDLVATQVINWTLSDRARRIEIQVGVKYGTDPERVIAILREVASQHPEVMRNPEPQAIFRAFGDSSLNFLLRVWVADFDRFIQVWSEITVGVNRALADAGIEIPFPQRDLHVRSVSEGLLAGLGRSEAAPSPGEGRGTHPSGGPAPGSAGPDAADTLAEPGETGSTKEEETP